MSGCKAPDAGGAPSAAKLYFLKEDCFHAPLCQGAIHESGKSDDTGRSSNAQTMTLTFVATLLLDLFPVSVAAYYFLD